MKLNIPKAHILIHAGDLTMDGEENELVKLFEFLNSQTQVEKKVIIAGNHDHLLDKRYGGEFLKSSKFEDMLNKYGIIYLEDSGIELFGLKIYGSPWYETFRSIVKNKTIFKFEFNWIICF